MSDIKPGDRVRAVGLPCADRGRVGVVEAVEGPVFVLHFDGDPPDAVRHAVERDQVEPVE